MLSLPRPLILLCSFVCRIQSTGHISRVHSALAVHHWHFTSVCCSSIDTHGHWQQLLGSWSLRRHLHSFFGCNFSRTLQRHVRLCHSAHFSSGAAICSASFRPFHGIFSAGRCGSCSRAFKRCPCSIIASIIRNASSDIRTPSPSAITHFCIRKISVASERRCNQLQHNRISDVCPT